MTLALAAVIGGCRTGSAASPGRVSDIPGPAVSSGVDQAEPARGVVVVTEHEDRRGLAGGEPAAVVTQIFLQRAGDRIDRFYAMVRDAATGRPVEEDRWSRSAPSVFQTRDWQACRSGTGPPPAPPMTTVGALLTDLLGPRRRPAGARNVAPHVWEFHRGPMRVRVRENGPGRLDRTVTSSAGAHVASTVHDVSMRPVPAFPGWRSGWRECTGR